MAMATRVVWSDKATSVLLEALRDRQSLWNTKSESYKNRNIKKKEYQEVVEIVKEDLPGVDLASVKCKYCKTDHFLSQLNIIIFISMQTVMQS